MPERIHGGPAEGMVRDTGDPRARRLAAGEIIKPPFPFASGYWGQADDAPQLTHRNEGCQTGDEEQLPADEDPTNTRAGDSRCRR
jgi:hypothetical protein